MSASSGGFHGGRGGVAYLAPGMKMEKKKRQGWLAQHGLLPTPTWFSATAAPLPRRVSGRRMRRARYQYPRRRQGQAWAATPQPLPPPPPSLLPAGVVAGVVSAVEPRAQSTLAQPLTCPPPRRPPHRVGKRGCGPRCGVKGGRVRGRDANGRGRRGHARVPAGEKEGKGGRGMGSARGNGAKAGSSRGE